MSSPGRSFQDSFLPLHSPNSQAVKSNSLLLASGILIGDRTPMTQFHHKIYGRNSLEVRAYWKIRRYEFSFSVSVLAEMKIIFLFALGARRELITLQCFGCC